MVDQGFSPSVTKACNTWLSIGSRIPAIAATWPDRPATTIADLLGPDRAARGLHARHHAALDVDPGDFAVLDQVDAALSAPRA